ncbi:succinate dehydrogenase, cytochrome b556 subunit [Dietzia psychralcaliphila]|nr:succinate dehydrogenase, cytochrome b556 subunit [Dietzia psychralcaliphila]PTM86829.1 succinate dehydrogenase subunit C [Dietzia psychralcaliphila]
MSTAQAPARPAKKISIYKGDPGMWSWVAHRVSGVAIFFFLFVHVLDTALVTVSPESYNAVIDTYKTPIVGLMEIGLVALVLFHALNGLRIVAVDFWSKGAKYQRQMLWAVLAIWVVVFAAATARLLFLLFQHI